MSGRSRLTTWGVWFACLGLVGTGGCGPSQEEYDEAQNRIRELQGELQAAADQRTALEEQLGAVRGQNEEMANRLRALGQNVEELEGTRESLQSDLEQTRRALSELQAREEQARARLATFRQLIERFRAMIESGRLRVRIVRNRMVVELPQGILFDTGSARLKEEGEQTLAEVAQVLATIPNRQFQIAGHTDDRPINTRRFPSNWELSTARAVTVTRYLVEQSLDAQRLSAAGYADSQPVASNDTEEGRAQNRRIEIQLVPNLDELPDLSSLEGLGSGS